MSKRKKDKCRKATKIMKINIIFQSERIRVNSLDLVWWTV